MKIKLNLILIYCIGLFTIAHAQSDKDTENAMAKMLAHYTGEQKTAVEFLVNIYDTEKDRSPELLTSTTLWIDGKEMYTRHDNLEYYQNETASLWLNHEEKLFRLLLLEQEKSNIPTPEDVAISSQLEILMTVCDTIVYNGKFDKKKKYTLLLPYGEYKKVVLWLHDNYTIDRTVYFFRDKTYGSKLETLVKDLTAQQLDKIKSEISPIREAISNNTIQQLFKEYDSLEE